MRVNDEIKSSGEKQAFVCGEDERKSPGLTQALHHVDNEIKSSRSGVKQALVHVDDEIKPSG